MRANLFITTLIYKGTKMLSTNRTNWVRRWFKRMVGRDLLQRRRLSATGRSFEVLERFPLRSLQIPTRLEEVDAGLGGDGLLDVSNGFD